MCQIFNTFSTLICNCQTTRIFIQIDPMCLEITSMEINEVIPCFNIILNMLLLSILVLHNSTCVCGICNCLNDVLYKWVLLEWWIFMLTTKRFNSVLNVDLYIQAYMIYEIGCIFVGCKLISSGILLAGMGDGKWSSDSIASNTGLGISFEVHHPSW